MAIDNFFCCLPIQDWIEFDKCLVWYERNIEGNEFVQYWKILFFHNVLITCQLQSYEWLLYVAVVYVDISAVNDPSELVQWINLE